MSFLYGPAMDVVKQHMINRTQNNATAAGAQDDFSKNMIDLMSQVNAGKTSLFNAQTANMNAKNDIATKNPSTFARQSALAGILSNTPKLSGRGSVQYTGPGDEAKATLGELQKQAMNNLLASPKDNPIPSGATTAMTPQLAVAPTINKFTFDGYSDGQSTEGAPVTYTTDKQTAVPRARG